MNLIERYQAAIQDYQLGNKKLVLAVSGGLDSTALVHLSHLCGLDFSIAHCNFQLRGAESERDEDFVKKLSEKYGVSLFVKKFETSTYAKAMKVSTQEAARELRYQWFRELQDDLKTDHLLTAHHADDDIETLLMNFFRGTGLKGLTGIPVTNVSSVHIVRPLLLFRRKELEAFAWLQGLEWVEDSSNASSNYTRNFFRNEVLPSISAIFPEVEENLLRNISRLKKTHRLYQEYVEALKSDLIEEKSSGERLVSIKKLLAYKDSSLPFEIFSGFDFSEKQVKEIMQLTNSASGKFVANQQWQVVRHRSMLVIASLSQDTGLIAIGENELGVLFPDGRLEWEVLPAEKYKIREDVHLAQFDASAVSFPLVLRRWRPGDYFYPFGLRKKKKLARFFIDQKMSKYQKENVWVLESQQRIVWVLGMRTDDRTRIGTHTKNVLVIRHLPS